MQDALSKDIYSHYKLRYDDCLKSRADQTLIAKIRTGKWKKFKEYKSRLDQGATDPYCNSCPGKIHNLIHWMTDCQATDAHRQRLFGTTKPPLSVAATEPLKLIQMSKFI